MLYTSRFLMQSSSNNRNVGVGEAVRVTVGVKDCVGVEVAVPVGVGVAMSVFVGVSGLGVGEAVNEG